MFSKRPETVSSWSLLWAPGSITSQGVKTRQDAILSQLSPKTITLNYISHLSMSVMFLSNPGSLVITSFSSRNLVRSSFCQCLDLNGVNLLLGLNILTKKCLCHPCYKPTQCLTFPPRHRGRERERGRQKKVVIILICINLHFERPWCEATCLSLTRERPKTEATHSHSLWLASDDVKSSVKN